MSTLKYQEMNKAPAQYLQESDIIVATDHTHDNRYYTKAEVDNKLLKKSDVRTGILSSGPGIKSFSFNGTENARVALDFMDITEDSSIGSSEQPARADHFHKKLYAGNGLVLASYDGSKEVTFELSKEVLNNLTPHEALMNGPGIKDFIYTGHDPVEVAVDFGDVDEDSGTSNLAARRDHWHKILSAGSGIAGFEYSGSRKAEIAVAWDARDEEELTGKENLVARADHGHTTVVKVEGEGSYLQDVKLENNKDKIELIKTYSNSSLEGALTEGALGFSVGNAQGIVYDWIVHEEFVCATELDVKDSKEKVEEIGSGDVYDLPANAVYSYVDSSWTVSDKKLRPGRIYSNPATSKGYFKYTDNFIPLWDKSGTGKPQVAYVCTTKEDVIDSKKQIEESGQPGLVYDLLNEITWIFNGTSWTTIPGCDLRPGELYINPATGKGYFKYFDETIVSLWNKGGNQLSFAYVCENEEDLADSKKEIEEKNPEDEEQRYIYDAQTNTVERWTGTEWEVVSDKELRPGHIYTNSATGKGFIYEDGEVKKLWQSGNVKPPVFMYICENDEDVWESKRAVEYSEIVDEDLSFIYDIRDNKVEQWTGIEWKEINKKIKNWTIYVNQETGKGFFKYPDIIKKLWGGEGKLPIVIRKGSMNISEIQSLRDCNIVHNHKEFSWYKSGSITVAELEEIQKQTPLNFDWLYEGHISLEQLENF